MDRTCINCGASGRANVIVGAIDNDEWRHVDPSVCVVHLLSQLTAERAAHAETRRELEEARAVNIDKLDRNRRALGDALRTIDAIHTALSAPPGADLVSVARACARVVEAAEAVTGLADPHPVLIDRLHDAIDDLAALRAGKEPTDAR